MGRKKGKFQKLPYGSGGIWEAPPKETAAHAKLSQRCLRCAADLRFLGPVSLKR